MMAIVDHIFTEMLERPLKPEQGLKMLREILSDHTLQRPPYSILIFTDKDVEVIIDFSMTTFLRHFFLYEYAFKPRVELVLRTDIYGGMSSQSALGKSPTELSPRGNRNEIHIEASNGKSTEPFGTHTITSDRKIEGE